MPRPSHRAPRRARWKVVLVGVGALVVGLGTALAATAQLPGLRDAPAAETIGAARQVSSSQAAAPVAVSIDPTTLNARGSVSRSERRVQPLMEAEEIEPKPTKAERAAALARRLANTPYDVVVGTFNVLGSNHTCAGCDRPGFPSASVRSRGEAQLILQHGVDVIGMQEMQADQLAAISSMTGMAAWPGTAWGSDETDNSILYDDEQLEVVDGSSFTINFMGRPRPEPILRMRDRATQREFYIVNVHLSAHGGRYAVERANGMATVVSVVNRLKATGLPVFVTGDMNDREPFYCKVVAPAALTAPNGGSYSGGGCSPPPEPLPVDWVVGSGVTWSSYWRDTTPVTRRLSDHFIISAKAHVD